MILRESNFNNLKNKLQMKKLQLFRAFMLFFSVLAIGTLSAQFDDLYYNPDTEDVTSYSTTTSNSSYVYDENAYEDNFDDQTYYDEDFNNYDYQYSSRVRRFNRGNRSRFGYYDPCFVDRFYYDPFFYDPFAFGPSPSIYISIGNPYGFRRNRFYGNHWGNGGFYDPYFFNGYGNYYGNNFYGNNFYGNNWNNGWNNGWNSCGNNFYGNNFYGNNFYGNNYYGNNWYGNGGNGNGWYNNNNNNGNNNNVSTTGYYGGRYGGSNTSSTEGPRKNPNARVPEKDRSLDIDKTQEIGNGGQITKGSNRILQTDSPKDISTSPYTSNNRPSNQTKVADANTSEKNVGGVSRPTGRPSTSTTGVTVDREVSVMGNNDSSNSAPTTRPTATRPNANNNARPTDVYVRPSRTYATPTRSNETSSSTQQNTVRRNNEDSRNSNSSRTDSRSSRNSDSYNGNTNSTRNSSSTRSSSSNSRPSSSSTRSSSSSRPSSPSTRSSSSSRSSSPSTSSSSSRSSSSSSSNSSSRSSNSRSGGGRGN